MTGGVHRRFNTRIYGIALIYVPTDDKRGGRVECGTFTRRITQLAKYEGTCGTVAVRNKQLTVRRAGTTGAIRAIRIVGFSGHFFGNGGYLMFSSVLARKRDCTQFTYTLRALKTRILKNCFLNGAVLLWRFGPCGCRCSF